MVLILFVEVLKILKSLKFELKNPAETLNKEHLLFLSLFLSLLFLLGISQSLHSTAL